MLRELLNYPAGVAGMAVGFLALVVLLVKIIRGDFEKDGKDGKGR